MVNGENVSEVITMLGDLDKDIVIDTFTVFETLRVILAVNDNDTEQEEFDKDLIDRSIDRATIWLEYEYSYFLIEYPELTEDGVLDGEEDPLTDEKRYLHLGNIRIKKFDLFDLILVLLLICAFVIIIMNMHQPHIVPVDTIQGLNGGIKP